MKTLILTTDYRPLLGGIATYCEEMATEFANKGDNVVMLAPWMMKAHQWDKKYPYKTVRTLNIWGFRELHFIILLIYYIIIKDFRHILSVVWFPCGFLCYFLSKFIRFDYYCAAFGSDFMDDKTSIKRKIKLAFSRLKIRTFNRASKVFSISDFTSDKLVGMGVLRDNINVAHMGVNIKKFVPAKPRSEFIKKYKLEDRRMLLTVARLDLRKGHDLVIKTLPRVIDKYPDVYYYIVGDGPERNYLDNIIAEQNLQEKVIFVGYKTDDLVQFYQACEIFVMISRDIRPDLVEGFGVTLIEAAACAKPVIGGRSGGCITAIKDNVSGILIDPLSESDLYKTLDRFLSDRETAKRFGNQAREHVKTVFTWNISASKVRKTMIREK